MKPIAEKVVVIFVMFAGNIKLTVCEIVNKNSYINQSVRNAQIIIIVGNGWLIDHSNLLKEDIKWPCGE